jgi:hypothetical protein
LQGIICSDPVKLVRGSHVSSLSRGKSHHRMRNSGPFLPFHLYLTTQTKYCVCLLLDFSKGSCWCAWPETSHSQKISHPHPGSSWFFPCFTLSHTPFPTLAQHQNTGKTSSCGNLIYLKKCHFFRYIVAQIHKLVDNITSIHKLVDNKNFFLLASQ